MQHGGEIQICTDPFHGCYPQSGRCNVHDQPLLPGQRVCRQPDDPDGSVAYVTEPELATTAIERYVMDELDGDRTVRATGDGYEMLARSATERPRAVRLPLTPIPPTLGCRVFTASLGRDRDALGQRVTQFLLELHRAGGHVSDRQVLQSSDREYHCVSIILWYMLPDGSRIP